MTRSESSQIWIEAGYRLFAYEGPEGVQVEKLARLVNRNKSGFYHHFGDRDLFFSELIVYHYGVIEQFCYEISQLRHFDPDYLHLLIGYKTSAFIQMQLRRNMKIPLFKETFHKVRKRTERELMPLWAAYVKLPVNLPLAQELWNILRDVFFTRLTGEDLDFDSLHAMVHEFSQIVEKLKHMAGKAVVFPVSPNGG